VIVTAVAFVVIQLSVEDCPEVIVEGLAVNDSMTGSAGATVTV
jgi:hypothetical protein